MLIRSRTMAALLFSLSMFSLPSFAGGKVEICHTPPGNPQQTETITVGEKSVPAHLAHGDKVGSCFQSLCPCAGAPSAGGQNEFDFVFDDTLDISLAVGGTCSIQSFASGIRNHLGNGQFIDIVAPSEFSAGDCQVGNDNTSIPIVSAQEYEACADLMRTIAFNDGIACAPDDFR